MFKNFMHSQLLNFFVSEPLRNLDKQKLSNFRIDIFYRGVISPFAIKLFLLPLSSHCSTQNIGFSNSGYVIKPLQPSSAVTELSLLQGTLIIVALHGISEMIMMSRRGYCLHCTYLVRRLKQLFNSAKTQYKNIQFESVTSHNHSTPT